MPALTVLLRPGVVVDLRIVGLCFLPLFLLSCGYSANEQAYPNKPLTFIVPWEEGTSGDHASRLLAASLQNEFGQPVSVENQAGSNGLASLVVLSQARSDGYTLGVIGEEITLMHWTGLTPLSFNRYSPIALIGTSPPVITVHADSPWQSVSDLITAIKSQPGILTASGTYIGGGRDLERIGFLEAVGLDPSALSWQPSPDAASAFGELLSGNVDVLITPLSEIASIRKTGEVRNLAIMSSRRALVAPTIPTLIELGISYESSGDWLMITAPEDLPDALMELLRATVWDISRKVDFQESMQVAGFQLQFLTGDPLISFLSEEDFQNGLLLNEAGLILE